MVMFPFFTFPPHDWGEDFDAPIISRFVGFVNSFAEEFYILLYLYFTERFYVKNALKNDAPDLFRPHTPCKAVRDVL